MIDEDPEEKHVFANEIVGSGLVDDFVFSLFAQENRVVLIENWVLEVYVFVGNVVLGSWARSQNGGRATCWFWGDK